MIDHALALAIQSGGSPADLRRLFADDAVFWAPIITLPVKGADDVVTLISNAVRIAGPVEYFFEANDGRQTFLAWRGMVDGNKLEAVTIVLHDGHGKISELREMMRPWPVSTLFRNAMFDGLSDRIPQAHWELGARSAPTGPDRIFTPIALNKPPNAADLTLHSPILTKPVVGRDLVGELIGHAHKVQSASSYTSVIATTATILELFDCDADGYPMEGVWLHKLNPKGEVEELSVFLRPYPAVTVLRNETKKLSDAAGGLGIDYWELAQSMVEREPA
jgi:hypothetical protein